MCPTKSANHNRRLSATGLRFVHIVIEVERLTFNHRIGPSF
jgi:hypothetical protein